MKQYMPDIEDYDYYLSTSRMKVNDYRVGPEGNIKYNMNALIEIDPGYFENKKEFKISPMEYWNSDPRGEGLSESEERIWSKVPYIPIDCIIKIHIFMDAAKTIGAAERTLFIKEITNNIKKLGIDYKVYGSSRYKKSSTINKARSDFRLLKNSSSMVVNEKHYAGPLYHSTHYGPAITILKTGDFKLSWYRAADGKTDESLYQFSFSRVKGNYYRKTYVNDVVFVLDGRHYTTRGKFRAEPFDFFAPDPSMKAGPSRGEA